MSLEDLGFLLLQETGASVLQIENEFAPKQMKMEKTSQQSENRQNSMSFAISLKISSPPDD